MVTRDWEKELASSRIFSLSKPGVTVKKILVIKSSALGDIVHLYPTVQFLRELFPDCQIDWVVEKSAATLVTAHPFVHKAISIDSKKWRKNFFKIATWQEVRAFLTALRRERYDLVVDFQGNTKSGIITALTKGAAKVGFGPKSVSERFNLLCSTFRYDPPTGLNARLEYLSLLEAWSGQKAASPKLTRLNLTADEQHKLALLIQKKAAHNIMVCPGSIWPNKQLKTPRLLELLQRIQPKGKLWLVYGNPEEQQLVIALQRQLNDAEVVEKLSLPLLQHWMGEMKLVIAMDSLPLHLAAEAGTPTFSLFGASSARKFGPLGVKHHTYQGACPYGRQFERRCPILRSCPTGACMDMDVDILLNNF